MGPGNGIGSYIQAWRHRLQPVDAGVPEGPTRRARGLRREELASLAGISVDYLVRLEQGRATNPSTQVLAALARALRLTTEERDHLYTVAGQAPPRRSAMTTLVPPSVQRLVDRLADLPVAVYDPAWTIITWNAAWAALMGDPSATNGWDRNLIWRTFTGKSTRVRKSDAELDEFETNAVADLRRVFGAYPEDARLHQLVEELRQASPRFAKLWAERVVNTSFSGRKTVDHPEVGPITLDCDVLAVAGSDLRIVVYTAEPASPDADRLRLVQVVGLQELSAHAADLRQRDGAAEN
ncbi:MAG TPA: helix-turn-helix transcriptional regulator [Acidimicrobiales bacterium]|nr:helix-turn-helix transcriptional regulator [Acidimicrobiales bacterium]